MKEFFKNNAIGRLKKVENTAGLEKMQILGIIIIAMYFGNL